MLNVRGQWASYRLFFLDPMKPFSDIPIGELLPQQPPFRFVDSLEEYTAELARIRFTPEEGKNLLMEDGCLSAAGLMEHMAQCSAVRQGYYSKFILHLPVKIGYIGQFRKLRINRLPKAGETLETTIFLKEVISNITLVDAEVRLGEELIATASLKSALKDD